jgi:DNA-binding response OmpR family regulator/signal transduction histidine kinase
MTATVLIVDDSLTVRMDLAEAFEAAGFNPLPCDTASKARAVLAGGSVSLAILDVLLPDADGVELLEEIRSNPSTSGILILMLSTEAEIKDRIRGLRRGADDYIGKPYDAEYVVARAKELLRTRKAPARDGPTILVIDDSTTFRNELRHALEVVGYTVLSAANGEEGLRLAAIHRPNALIVDGVMPGLDGATVVRRIRLDAALRGTPCLLLTAADDAGAELRALDAGADAFVRKEDDIEVLLARLGAALRSATTEPPDAAALLGPKRLLVVDDSETYLQEIAALLRGDGYDVVMARSGEQALEMLAVQSVDCVLLDLMMPGLGGKETCRRIKEAPAIRHVPLIMVTSVDDRTAMMEGLAFGADDYIAKSSEFEVLKARVRSQIRRKQFEDEYRRIREDLLRSELEAAEARAARQVAETRAAMSEELERRVEERTAQLTATAQALVAENSRREVTERNLQAQLARLRLLGDITRAIAQRQDLASVFRVVIRNLEENLPANFCRICLRAGHPEVLAIWDEQVKRCKQDSRAQAEASVRIGIGAAGRIARMHEALLYDSDASRRWTFIASLGLHSLIAAPLHVGADVFGVLFVARQEPDAFSHEECEFLRQLSEHVALAVRQGQLHEALQAAYDDLRETQRAVLQQERLRALGQMASGIAHDINNAISPVGLYVESILESDSGLEPRSRQQLNVVRRAVDDVAKTVARMREFCRSRQPQITLAPVDLNLLIEQVLELTRVKWTDIPQQRGMVIAVVKELDSDLPALSGVESEIREALTNLIFNAVDAMPEGGSLTLRTMTVPRAAGASGVALAARNVYLEVADTGVGMDEETSSKCLEPFFTTKGERGTGLGLAMVYGAVQRHGADIKIHSVPGRGTTIRLSFPVLDAASAADRTAESAAEVPGHMRILLIDDDPLVLKSLSDTLEKDGHDVMAASDARDGVKAFQASRKSEPFDVVVTDLGMPYLDGQRVAILVKETSPTTPVILLTGWGQQPASDSDVALHSVDFVLGKPPKIRELRTALAQCYARLERKTGS